MPSACCLAVSILGLLILGEAVAAAEAPIGALPSPGKASVLPAPQIDLGKAARGADARTVTDALARLNNVATLALRGRTEKRVFRKVAPKVVLVVTADAMGSGTVVDAKGLVLTNWHVIEGHERVLVAFYPEPGRQAGPADLVAADVVRIDQVADLALLAVRRELPRTATPIAFGANSKVEVGEDVHAIGHPQGEVWTYTGGFVSQIRQDYEWTTESGVQHLATVIQTQTPINPGNSGGPLLDDDARLVGVNSFGADGEGLNYAVSIDDVKSFLYRSGDRLAEPAAVARRECEPHLMHAGRTEADDGDMHTVDLDCDGTEDAALVDYDDKSSPLQLFVDIDDNWVPGGVILDKDRDGRWDVSYWDTDHDGTTDLVGYHPDGAFEPSEYAEYEPEG